MCWLRRELIRLPAASGEALIACGTKAEDKAARRGDSMGGGPMLQEHSRDIMLRSVRSWNGMKVMKMTTERNIKDRKRAPVRSA